MNRTLVVGSLLASTVLGCAATAGAQVPGPVAAEIDEVIRLHVEESLRHAQDELIRIGPAMEEAAKAMAALQVQPAPAPEPPSRRGQPGTRAVAIPPMPPMPPLPPTIDGFSSVGGLYERARSSIDAGRYDRALNELNQLITRYDGKPDAVQNRVDAAMYWKAYPELKLNTLSESLKTLQDMQKRYADSRWLRDAKALELEVRQASGQNVSPDMQSDDELKLLALRGLMQTDPDRAVPRIEQLLAGGSSVRVKENALFVLSQSRSPRAASIIGNAAKNSSNPDLQLKAVRYLGAMRTEESSKLLEELYRSTSDTAVKRAIIQSFSGSQVDKVKFIFDSEKDIALRKTAVQTVGNMGRERSGELLRSMYATESNAELKKEIVTALYRQQNAAVLVQLARAEKDPTLKKQIVSHLSNMKSKEATDYMLELLK